MLRTKKKVLLQATSQLEQYTQGDLFDPFNDGFLWSAKPTTVTMFKKNSEQNEPFIRLIYSTSNVERKRKYNTQSAYPKAVSAAAAVNTHKAIYCPF